VPPGADGLLMLPYFSGERTPINDPGARGVIAGLTLRHGRGHMFRAALEGVAYGVRDNLQDLTNAGGAPKRVIAVGGGTRGDTWVQIVSDVADVIQLVPETTIGASFGDAFLAGVAAGALAWSELPNWVGEYRRSEEPRLNSSHVKISYAVFCLKKNTSQYCHNPFVT